ncbi:3-oxoacyl-ACP reductase FabG [Streptomyces zingiberis]|uniref:3-oxoacyl-ACP reductase FabG n=1 Tax=Streptomyces zingiberis TaxID=2053010 RepID=A0ABX1BYA5_9ACTN|nr:3-oxoacyl-ACP reductase FabG [Streptomyces zingiberis]NJQ01278.1 3-oxoacyl-ACP reductase FabG [Streptomyces zingiberis]
MSRSVLVTGGNRGIGLAVAREFAEAGDRVALTYRTGEPPPAATRLGCAAVTCDVTDAAQVERAYKEVEAAHGPVEVLVANAGITRDRLLLRMTERDFADVLDTNLTGVFRVVRRAAEEMVQARRGRIVLISSAVALLGAAGQSNYAAAKAGLVGFARSVAREFGSRGITCNVVAPGFVETAMTGALTERQRAAVLDKVPAGRGARPAEVAAAVRFLASGDAAYITGAVLPVDGGLGMGH